MHASAWSARPTAMRAAAQPAGEVRTAALGRRRIVTRDAADFRRTVTPGATAPLRQGRRCLLRPDLGAAQVGARLRIPTPRCTGLCACSTAVADPLYMGAAHRAHGHRGHRPGRSARLRPSRWMPAPPTSAWAARKVNSRSPMQCSIWLVAPKSNAAYVAYNSARKFIAEGQELTAGSAAPAERTHQTDERHGPRQGLPVCA
jgi:hypothetical protein